MKRRCGDGYEDVGDAVQRRRRTPEKKNIFKIKIME